MTMPDATIGAPGAPPPRNWWQRNWKWVVPVGCLTIVALFALFVAGVVGIAFRAMKSTDVVREAVATAAASPAVREALGEPVRQGWYLTGNIQVNGPSGQADVAIPLKGSQRDGTLYVVAEKSAGRWTYETLEVEVEGTEERINLLEERVQ
jgi:Cytochrome oxidase complex assembly protein 1